MAEPLIMLLGAGIAGLLAVILIELIKRYGSVEPGAAMGVVFSVMFALGVLLLEMDAQATPHIDADCVLYGSLETLVWFDAPMTFSVICGLGRPLPPYRGKSSRC